MWIEEGSHSREKMFQGKGSGAVTRSPMADNSSGGSLPSCDSCFHSFSPSSASECAESASGPSCVFFSIPFLSFLIFSHSSWQLQGGEGQADGSSCLYVWDLCSLSLWVRGCLYISQAATWQDISFHLGCLNVSWMISYMQREGRIFKMLNSVQPLTALQPYTETFELFRPVA